MTASNMKKPSKTNWEWVESLTDDEIDTSDIPPLTESFYERATLQPPRAVTITLHLDPDVLAWFRAQGKEFEKRINAALRIYAEAHKE